MAELWRVKIRKVFKLAGPFYEPATPHRFRHTFVHILLQNGVPVADVAELKRVCIRRTADSGTL
jgi:site-specific recombinase XerD